MPTSHNVHYDTDSRWANPLTVYMESSFGLGVPLRSSGSSCENELRKHEGVLVKQTVGRAEEIMEDGAYFLIENLQDSAIWSTELLKRLLRQPGVHVGHCHQCRFELRGQGGRLLKKATTWRTNLPELLRSVSYPWKLALAITTGVQEALRARGAQQQTSAWSDQVAMSWTSQAATTSVRHVNVMRDK